MTTSAITKIRNILATIPDPEIPVISLEELGVIQHIELKENDVWVTITPTYSGCPALEQMKDDIKSTLIANGYDRIHIDLSYSPAWSSKWMTPNTKIKLKDYGIAPPQHCCGNELCASSKCAKITCPHCNSKNTLLISEFGSTPCKALYQCHECLEPFEYFKALV